MNLQEYTIKSQEVIQHALSIALAQGNQAVENGHLLQSLFEKDDTVLPFILKKQAINTALVNKTVEALVKSYPKVQGGQPYLSNETNRTLTKAKELLKEFGDEYVSLEHLLLAIVKSNDATGRILKEAGAKDTEIVAAIKELRKGSKVTDQHAENAYQALGKYAIDLNEMAKKGKLDPVIGRDEEIRRVIQILSRRTKNNPILIGEPGVGKTAIAEGIAHRIVNGDVPEDIKTKTVFSLDLSALIAGAKFQGEFEERLKAVVKEVKAAENQIILFIDEIHTLVGAGKNSGAMDAANILKPALARGELRAIGATTLAEYQKYIETDKALERRFQPVMVEEPDTEDAIAILRGLKERYENHHKIRIKDEAIIAAVELSQRYIADRFLPDKAIDLIDEAGSKLRIEIDSVPEEVDEVERKIMQYEIEREAMKRENDTDRINQLNFEISKLKEESTALKSKWQTEKGLVEEIQTHKGQIEQYRIEASQAERDADFEKVAEIRYGKLREVETKVKNLQVALAEYQKDESMLKEEVDGEDIAEVVSKWTGIPVKRMLESERQKLLRMEQELGQRVVGQDEAVMAVSDAVRRSRSGLQDPKKPIGSFLFMGTTGVGKTELAKAVASFLFNDEQAMVRIDMSEFQESHAVSRLIGAPPGYVGYDEGGQLTEAVRRRPYSVILLDEIEKAHPDVFNVLLQVLDDGRLTDNKGRTANFRNTIVIMTSNIGSQIINDNFDNLGENKYTEVYDATKIEIFDLLRKTLGPEFLNRIDDIVLFRPLTKSNIKAIVELNMKMLVKQLESMGITATYTPEAVNLVADVGFDPQYGARPLKRALQRMLINELSKQLLAGSVTKDSAIVIDNFEKKIVFYNQKV